nr:type I polyketide synthase [Streptomyces chrestomyceticus]
MTGQADKLLEALRASVKETERLRQQNRQLVSAASEPLAIVGMSCRYPGGVTTPEELWELVSTGGDAIAGVPADRGWDTEDLHDPGRPDSSSSAEGGFLRDAAAFDADFFGISPREALAMDPQQRLLLETSWEALERAGVAPASLRGSQTGVFVGVGPSDYGANPALHTDDLQWHLITGGATSVMSGRVSYLLGLQGPAVSVDTACSSSLVALHLAAQAVRAGECSLALAGGATVMASAIGIRGFSRQDGLAADGRCKAFSADADGMGMGEGAGMVVVERLSDARRNGHPVLAVLRGSAVNQDGASNGLTAPNGPSQQRVIRAALAGARLTASEVDVVEAHGTGTKLGDPIEAQALLATYGQERPEGRPLWLGSVKSNIGHAQQAAGVAGVIKMVLALQHGELPRTLHADEPSPHVDWASGEVKLLTEPVPWPSGDRVRRAGVSSFGLSGTNAHVILEEAPAAEGGEAVEKAGGPAIPVVTGAGAWVLSGRTAEALSAQAGRLGEWVSLRPSLRPVDVAWSLAATRSVFEHRAVVVGGDREQVLAGLGGVASGVPAGAVVSGVARSGARPVFAFAGQGSQWVGMGRELAGASPVFAARLDECAAALEPYVDWSLTEVLAGAEGAPALEAADVVQPALWAVMVSLAAVWEAAGVAPEAVVGHSQGEIAAATVAGMLSLEDGARVVALRSGALKVLAGAGGMLSVSRPAAEVEERLVRFGERVSLAAVNGPSATVVSGEPEALEELRAEFEAEGARARMVAVDYASHSAQVDRLEEEITSVLAGISPRRGRVPMVSAMTGETLTGEELDAGYWFRSLRATVHYDRAVRVLAGRGHQVFVEVTPHPVLVGAMHDTLQDLAQEAGPGVMPAAVCGTLRRDEGGADRLVASLAEAFVNGASVDWQAVLPAGQQVELPTYAFQHERFWPKAAATVSGGDPVSLGLGAVGHPLLGAAVELAGGEGVVCTGRLSVRTHPWLADHAVGGVVLLPGTGFVELAVCAGDQAGCGVLEELTLQAPLVFPEDGAAVQVQVVLAGPDAEGRRAVEVFSRSDVAGQSQGWTQHASGVLAPAGPAAAAEDDFAVWPPRDATTVDVSGFYQAAGANSYGYGPAFQGLRAVWRRGEDVFAEVALPEEVAQDAAAFGLHPALLDAVLHASALLEAEGEPGEIRLPFAWTGVELHASGASVLRARLRRDAQGTLAVTAADAAGQPVISVASLITRPVDTGQLGSAVPAVADALFTVAWMPISGTESVAPVSGEWALIGADRFGVAEALGRTGITVQCFPGLEEAAAAVEAGQCTPAFVLVCGGGEGRSGEDPARAAARVTGETLVLVQEWLGEERLADSRLVILTRAAAAVSAGEGVADLPAATLAGLVRSAQSENPDRLLLVDLPATGTGEQVTELPVAVATGEPELALRNGAVHARRLVRPSGALPVPEGRWRLEPDAGGSLEGLSLLPAPEADEALAVGQVRIAVGAAGLNFRDVLIALGMYPGGGVLGSEIAGTVLEAGPGVDHLTPGDRVTGIGEGGFGPVVVTDARQLVRIPDGWSFAEAASVPTAFMTAWYALVELAGAKPGQRVLVHAATGGVGMAAVQIARYLGLEVFATASPGKWPVLAAMGLDAEHVSSSRTAGFEADFLAATDGAGVDIVVNSLAGELTDASLRLLPRGGAFVEMGRTDVRDAQAVAADRPGVTYRSFDLGEAGPEGLGTMLGRIVELLSAGELQRLPMRAWEVRRARDAFRFMQQARHTGKSVLTIPAHLSAAQQPEAARPGSRSALITGGTGTLGSLVARHLVVSGRAQHVVLTSRSGPGAVGIAALAARLAQAGASVQVVACDAADRPELAAVVAAVPAGYPLRTVVHTAGVLDDGTVGSLTAQRVAGVLRPKADGAWNLHELTQGLDLDHFVLFSSSAAAFGVPGQGNYVAANAFLDALAAERRASGLPGVSLGWGLWAEVSGLTGQLAESDRSRMSRGGALALSADEGLALLDLCLARDEAVLVPSRLDLAGLRAQAARSAQVPPLWRALVGASSGRRSAAGAGDAGADSLHQRLSGLSGQERTRLLTDLVRTHAAAVLGHASAEAVEAGRAFTDLGFDSLTAVELRNRLSAATGLRLPATLVFDYPNPAALAGHLRARIIGDGDGDGQAVSPLPVGTTQQTSGEPIAIVGLACRFPGGVNDPEGFWRLLADGTDAVSRFPDDRGWDVEALYDPDPDSIGTSYTREGGFIGDAGGFDADFFGISPREALAMDPQQRQVLETSWEALERAGIDPSALRGSQTGVFVGGFASAYGIGVATGDEGAEGNLTTGFATSVLSGRVSYALGLEGPAVTVDTACSSSLVALHLACQAIRAGECSMALAGGSTIISTPDGIVGFSRQRGLAADGRCKAFSADADGMGFAEGTGVLVVERLSDARRNGHPVLAVVRGSAVNQDGASNGLTAPNGPSQQRVIRAALAGAHLTAADVDVVEAHGTGTKLGDPIEAQALLATYGQERPEGRPLWLGSVKSNIGHTQAAAGVAGVIKMVLALQHGQLPRTLHADEPSPHIDWTEGEVRLLTEPVPWQTNDRPRIAGISSFGISGTNAHVLLEEAPAEEPAHSNGYPVDADAAASAPVLSMAGADPAAETVSAWLVSGRSAAGLAAQADRLRDWLTARPELGSADVAWSLAATRSVFEHRAVVVGGDREQVLAGLAGLASGTPSGSLVAGTARPDARPVFSFAGQGSQWVGMGRELARTSPVFAGRLAECAAALAPYVDWSLSDVLAGAEEAPALEAADVVQPALWAVMVSLAAVWEAAGVAPEAVVGHSQGEIAAATVAGMLSLQDGARVVALRSRALKVLAGAGGMLSVSRPAAEVEERLVRFGDRVSLAAVNGPSATVVSGEPAALEELKSEFEAAGARARMVAVDYASHCAQVDRLEEEITSVLAGISPRRGRVPMVSAMTGETLTGEELDAGYWFRSLRATVHYDRAVRVLAGQGHQMFVEVTPHPVLMGAMNDTLEEVAQESGPGIVPAAVCGTLRRDEGGPAQLVTSLAEAFVNGASVDWQAVLPAGKRVELPTYAFQHERFWPKAAATVSGGDPVSLGLGAVGHPLLGAEVELAGGAGLVCTGRLSVRTHPWLADHAVGGVVLLPGTGFVELAVCAGDQAGCGVLEELTLQAPLVFPEDGAAVQVQVVLAGPDAEGRRAVEVFSRSDVAGQSQGWTQHASGVLAPVGPAAAAEDDFAVWPPRDATTVDVSNLYQSAAEGPYGYGPAFQGLRAAWRRGEDVFAEVALPEEVAQDAAAFGLHPALLDAVLQAAFLMGDAEKSATEEVRLPFAWTGVELHASGASVLRARLRRDAQGTLTVTAADAAGQPVISVTSLITRPVDTSQLGSAVSPVADALFTVAWMPISGTESVAPVAGEWALIGADRFGVAETLGRTGIPVQCFPGLKELATATADRKIDPAFVLACTGGEGRSEEDPARAAARMTGETLRLAQEWLGEDRLADSRLVILTRGAVAVSAGEGVADLPAAALAGLVRSAQSENPDRLLLVDLPATNTADQIAVLPDALPAALAAGEPEVAIRDTAVHGRRLTRPSGSTAAVERPANPSGARSALITGGTGTLGGLVAGHLVVSGRVEHVVLTSRSGPGAAGAAVLAARLAQAGASVQVTACDAADRQKLTAVMATIPVQAPLRTVVHTAGVLDDGTVGSLTAQRVAGVLRPKADGAWNLHELTQGLDLDHFVLFSSSAAAFGVPGQGNYVAANAFLDALAAERRASGLPGVSLGWGLWAEVSGLTGQLAESDRSRMSRGGALALSADEGLALLDLCLARDEAVLVPSRLDLAGLRAQAARSAQVPPLWRALVSAGTGRRSAAGTDDANADSLHRQLAALPAAERDEMLLNLVRAHVAAVLGHASAEAVEPGRAFTDLGFDSLTAVQLRNRLNTATGLRLPATLVFDYPNPAALAGHLRGRLGDGSQTRTKAATAPAAAETSGAGAPDEPIAIVGMSCRFPGGTADPEDLWRMLRDGEDAISAFPTDRGWDLDGLHDPDAARSGTARTQAGGFVQDAASFDAGFFEISPREALAMDPQQRLLLELAWEAFERSGIDPATLRSSPTGTFVGGYTSGYETSVLAQGGAESQGHLMTGIATSVLSGRLAYTFGLEGPAVTVDTACSSALVALHLAAQSLRSGECSLALAGGVTVMATPGTFVEFSRQRGLAADGRCKAFAAAADGTGFAEGAGLLVIERLSDAQRNGHPVLAVLRGSATNQDGASNGLTAPNGPSQQRVIRAALANSRLAPSDVDVVEAHGTGTKLGDPIEAQALLATYGQDRGEGDPLWLGSVKSNIGHTQAAAGVAGVIKMVLALQHGELPRTLHVDEPSPHIDWTGGEVRLLTEPVPWQANGRPRRAGVSSFGISGTNAHVILEEAPAPPAGSDRHVPSAGPESHVPPLAAESHVPPAGPETHVGPPPGAATAPAAGSVVPSVVPWPLSARTPEALRAQAGRLRQFLLERPELDLVDVGFSLATTRTAFDHRAVVQGTDRDGLLAGLAVAAAGVQTRDVVTGTAKAGRKPVFVFPGAATSPGASGADVRLDAVAALLEESPVFADRIADCEQALAPFVDWKVTEVLRAGEDSPALTTPEIHRPVLWAVLVALAALWRSAGVHPAAVAGHGVGEIAAAQVAGVLTTAEAARLAVLCGGTPAGPGAVQPRPGTVPLYSTRSMDWVDGAELEAEHWLPYPGQEPPVPVRELAEALAGAGLGAYVEVGPEPVLATALTQALQAEGSGADRAGAPVVTGALRRGELGLRAFTSALAALHVRGVTVDWAAVLGGGRRVDLPTYAFQRERYWPQPPARTAAEAPAAGSLSPDEQRLWSALAEQDMSALSEVLGTGTPLREDMPLGEVLAYVAAWRRERTAPDGTAETGAAGTAEGTAPEGAHGAGADWRQRLAEVGPAQQQELLSALVREEIAAMLGYGSVDSVPQYGDVFELGMTSMSAVQLRLRMNELTGLTLPEGFVYDLYMPEAIAEYLLGELTVALREGTPEDR